MTHIGSVTIGLLCCAVAFIMPLEQTVVVLCTGLGIIVGSFVSEFKTMTPRKEVSGFSQFVRRYEKKRG